MQRLTLSRRGLVIAAGMALKAFTSRATTESDRITLYRSRTVPYQPDVMEVWHGMIKESSSWQYMVFTAYGWEEEATAAEEFETVSAFHIDKMRVFADDEGVPFGVYDIPAIGDEHESYLAEWGEYDHEVLVVLRSGRHVLEFRAAPVDPLKEFANGDVIRAVSKVEFLEEFMKSTTDETLSFIPSGSALPPDWESVDFGQGPIHSYLVQAHTPFPEATPVAEEPTRFTNQRRHGRDES